MVIQNGMYFALGFLAAEFRADKDRLRAEFAITLRKHQLKIEALRDQLAARVVALDAARSELAALRTERDEQFSAIETFQLREQELTTRIRDLERDGAALAARLRREDED